MIQDEGPAFRRSATELCLADRNCAGCWYAAVCRMARPLSWVRHRPLFAGLLTTALLCVVVVQLTVNSFVVGGTYHVEPRLIQALYTNRTASSSSSSSSRTGRGLLTQVPVGNRKPPSAIFNLHRLGDLFRLLSGQPRELPRCSFPPQSLVGQVSVTYQSMSWQRLEGLHPELDRGGKWRPHNCTSPYRVAVIVPYRDRTDHLKIFLNHIHPFLQKQLIAYGIYIVEQDAYTPFNRGLLLNIGYLEAMADDTYDCAIFHDVDLLPENDHNLYTCPDQPRHMSVAVDELAYRLPYDGLFGGVEAFRKDHFESINGFSNAFFGWGGEDDDLFSRLGCRGLNITRYSPKIARYSMMRHKKNIANPSRFKYLKTSKERLDKDGLNSVIYRRERFEKRRLYTWIYVRVNQTAIMHNIERAEMQSEPTKISQTQVNG